MNIDRLFQVLVVGGTLLASHSIANQAPSTPVSDPAAVVCPPPADPIFCDQPGACEKDPCTGKLKVKEGFECCWGTSCENN